MATQPKAVSVIPAELRETFTQMMNVEEARLRRAVNTAKIATMRSIYEQQADDLRQLRALLLV